MNLPLIDGVCQQNIFLQTTFFFFNLNFLPRNSMCSFRLDAGCPLLPQIDNGHVDILQPNIIGTSAKYTCSTGFFLAGRAIRKCTSDGAWDGREPSCEKGEWVSPVSLFLLFLFYVLFLVSFIFISSFFSFPVYIRYYCIKTYLHISIHRHTYIYTCMYVYMYECIIFSFLAFSLCILHGFWEVKM